MSTPLPKTELLGDFAIYDKDIVQDLNNNFEILDILTQATVNKMVSILPTSGMMDGDTYILDTNNSINYWNGNSWIVIHPKEGWEIYDEDTATFYFYDGSVWTSGSTLASNVGFVPTPEILSTNVQNAIEEVQDNMEAEYLVLQSLITSSINAATLALFPVGKIDMTLGANPPNALNWLQLNQDYTLSKTTYADLYNALNTQGLIASTPSYNGSIAYEITGDPTNFGLRSFNALSPRSIGAKTLFTRTKTGPLLGEFQEDQMQRITGDITTPLYSGDVVFPGGALNSNTGANFANTGLTASNRTRSVLTFDSSISPNARASSTTVGETRANTFGVYYWIRY